jgi:hypothetical protein
LRSAYFFNLSVDTFSSNTYRKITFSKRYRLGEKDLGKLTNVCKAVGSTKRVATVLAHIVMAVTYGKIAASAVLDANYN